MGTTVFGKDERKALDYIHKRFVDNPGPGTYSHFNEIGEYSLTQRIGGAQGSKFGSEIASSDAGN